MRPVAMPTALGEHGSGRWPVNARAAARVRGRPFPWTAFAVNVICCGTVSVFR
jgi:hypothetical protein